MGCFFAVAIKAGADVSELELFGLDGWRSWFRRNKGHEFVPAPGQTCLNCGTELKGEFCYHCGQDADTHHRTIGHLFFEVFEGLFHLDGRLWTTLPPLLFNPGRLARDLMEGRLARHIPPFRIFLVTLLLFMLIAEHVTEEQRLHPPVKPAVPATAQGTHTAQIEVIRDASDSATASNGGDDGNLGEMLGNHASELQSAKTTTMIDKKTGHKMVVNQINLFALTEADARLLGGLVAKSDMKPRWLKDDLVKALNDKERFFAAVFTWGHRLALLLLPIVGLSLSLLYLGRRKDGRRLYLYDHLLIAMNLLSFMFLTSALGLLLPEPAQPAWSGVSALWTLWNFFSTLRGAYGSSILGAILKSLLLWIMTGLAFSLVIAGVIFISLTVG